MIKNTDNTETRHNDWKSKQRKNETTLVQSHFMTLGQETTGAYSIMLPSPHWAFKYTLCYN